MTDRSKDVAKFLHNANTTDGKHCRGQLARCALQ